MTARSQFRKFTRSFEPVVPNKASDHCHLGADPIPGFVNAPRYHRPSPRQPFQGARANTSRASLHEACLFPIDQQPQNHLAHEICVPIASASVTIRAQLNLPLNDTGKNERRRCGPKNGRRCARQRCHPGASIGVIQRSRRKPDHPRAAATRS